MTDSPIPPVKIFTEFCGALTDYSKNQGVVIVFPARKSEVCYKKENLRKLFTKDRESVLAVKKNILIHFLKLLIIILLFI